MDNSGAKDTESAKPGSTRIESGHAREVENILRDELGRGDRALRGVPPILTHLLAGAGYSLVSDAIVARLRGMLSSLAKQLARAKYGSARPTADNGEIDRLADALASDSVILSYCYALAMEGHVTERLEQRSSLDPVLSPLFQELIASQDPAVGELAMTALAAQSRFIQSQRRMDLPLGELPAELFQAVLSNWEALERNDPAVAPAIRTLRSKYDEAASRLGLLARLVSSMRNGAVAALELDHAGLALFTSAIAALSKQPRELAVLACHERQTARLALSLRAAGLNGDAIERQFLLLEPSDMPPRDMDTVAVDRAAALLNQSAPKFEG